MSYSMEPATSADREASHTAELQDRIKTDRENRSKTAVQKDMLTTLHLKDEENEYDCPPQCFETRDDQDDQDDLEEFIADDEVDREEEAELTKQFKMFTNLDDEQQQPLKTTERVQRAQFSDRPNDDDDDDDNDDDQDERSERIKGVQSTTEPNDDNDDEQQQLLLMKTTERVQRAQFSDRPNDDDDEDENADKGDDSSDEFAQQPGSDATSTIGAKGQPCVGEVGARKGDIHSSKQILPLSLFPALAADFFAATQNLISQFVAAQIDPMESATAYAQEFLRSATKTKTGEATKNARKKLLNECDAICSAMDRALVKYNNFEDAMRMMTCLRELSRYRDKYSELIDDQMYHDLQRSGRLMPNSWDEEGEGTFEVDEVDDEDDLLGTEDYAEEDDETFFW